eukprot:748871-Hanusia_phi.AAC.1
MKFSSFHLVMLCVEGLLGCSLGFHLNFYDKSTIYASERHLPNFKCTNERNWYRAGQRSGPDRFLSMQASDRTGLDTNHAKKSEAFQAARADHLAPCIILVRPFLDQNVGSTARSMLNFGLSHLRLVSPVCDHLSDDAFARAAGARDVLQNARVFSTVEEAVEDLQCVFATTARLRDMQHKVLSAENAAKESIQIASQSSQKTGFLFGPESSGLSNADLSLVDCVVQIPTNPFFSSLNLAQAVNLISYEHQRARDSYRRTMNEHESSFTDFEKPSGPKDSLADKKQMLEFFKRLEDAMNDSEFVVDASKREIVYQNIRNVFLRSQMTVREVGTLQGVVTALTGGKRRRRAES